MRKSTIGLAMTLSAINIASPASAVLVTKTYDFTATNFQCFFCSVSPPFSDVSGSFTLSFDDSETAVNQPGVIVNSLTIPYVGPVVYTYLLEEGGLLQIGGQGDTYSFTGKDFLFNYRNNPNLVPVSGFVYTYQNENGLVRGSASVTQPLGAAVPEPTTWALLLTGFVTVGYAMRRNKHKVALSSMS